MATSTTRRYLNAKGLVYGGMFRPVEEHLRETARLLGECFGSDDHCEGVAAFLERDSAAFTGR